MLNPNEDYSQAVIVPENMRAIGETIGPFRPSIDQMVAVWLHSKFGRSESKRTLQEYGSAITSFRKVLQHAGYDLDADISTVATLAQGWAMAPYHHNRPVGKHIAASTFNLRITMISSFYIFAIKRRWFETNPMQIVDKRKTESSDYARPLLKEEIDEKLAQIDRSTLLGKRDYALLSLALTTGRRRAELLALRWGDIIITGSGKAVVIWRRCKGGKTMEDELQPGTLAAILDNMYAVYGPNIDNLAPDTPIWVRLDRGSYSRGQPLSGPATMRQIWQRRLGTGKVHTTRHTFAITMEEAGAKLSDIGARLGHSNLSTTSIYMQRLHKSENPYGSKLEELFGIECTDDSSRERVPDKMESVASLLQEHPEFTNIQIARMAGVSYHTVGKHRRKRGIPPSTHFKQE